MGGGWKHHSPASITLAAFIARNAFFEKMTDDDVTGSNFLGVWKLDNIPSLKLTASKSPWKVTETQKRKGRIVFQADFFQGLLLLDFRGCNPFFLCAFSFGGWWNTMVLQDNKHWSEDLVNSQLVTMLNNSNQITSNEIWGFLCLFSQYQAALKKKTMGSQTYQNSIEKNSGLQYSMCISLLARTCKPLSTSLSLPIA